VPYETLRYIIGDVNYGGRVTDYMDQRTVAAVLGTYICIDAVEDHAYRCPLPAPPPVHLAPLPFSSPQQPGPLDR